MRRFVDEVYSSSPIQNYATNKTMIKSIDDIGPQNY